MQLKGNLDTSIIINILQLVCNDQKTGTLQVTDGDNVVKVIIKEGTIIYATGTQKAFRLGVFLKNAGIISGEQLEKSLEQGKAQQKALGKILVENGFISKEDLKNFLRKQVEEILFDMFLWQEGNFEYNDIMLDINNFIVFPLNTMNLILEASRRIDEMSIFTNKIPNDLIVFVISEKINNKEDIILAKNEWQIIAMLDGTRTVSRLIDESGYDSFSVYRILFSLLSFDLIKDSKEVRAGKKENLKDYFAVIKVFNDIIQII